jgi:hypothetical protein
MASNWFAEGPPYKVFPERTPSQDSTFSSFALLKSRVLDFFRLERLMLLFDQNNFLNQRREGEGLLSGDGVWTMRSNRVSGPRSSFAVGF